MWRATMTCAVAAAIGCAAPALAQAAGSRPTREFVQAAGQSDAFEILESQTALTQSTNPQVRAFAEQMIHDHGQTRSALATATAQSGLAPPPTAVGSDQAPLLGALQALRGKEFDRAFAQHQVLAHSSALVVEQDYAATGDDRAVRQVAAAAVPVISAHRMAAQQLQASLQTP